MNLFDRSTNRKVLLTSAFVLTFQAIAQAQQVAIISHPLPRATPTQPLTIAAGSDGALWFTQPSYDGGIPGDIGRITTSGVITDFRLPLSYSPSVITSGPDGALWFAEFSREAVWRITTGGSISGFPTPGIMPAAITSGPDAALWFTDEQGRGVGRIDTSGVFTLYPFPIGFGCECVNFGIAAGSDGALWFTETQAGTIGRITTDGAISGYTLPAASSPYAITAGPDGALWFTEASPGVPMNKVGRITTGGAVTVFTTPLSGAFLSIATGADGALWFTDNLNNSVDRITVAGLVTDYSVPGSCCAYGITSRQDGSLWFTENFNDRIGQVVFPTALLTANPSTGIPGTEVMFNGSGFRPNEIVNLYNNSTGSDLLTSATADPAGLFTVSTSLALGPYGYNSIAGVGQSSNTIGVTSFSVTPALTVEPASVAAGDKITVQGFGFGIQDSIAIYCCGNTLKFQTSVTTNDRGQFSTHAGNSVSITVPAGTPAGVHKVTGQDGYLGVSAVGYFTVE